MPNAAWVILILAAGTLAAYSQPWAAAALVPVAAALSWSASRSSERAHAIRLDETAARLARETEASALATQHAATFNAYLDAVDTPIIATDTNGRVTMLNKPARALFDHVPAASSGSIGDLVSAPDVLTLHGCAARGEACRARVRLALGGNARFYDVAAAPVRTTQGTEPPNGVVLTLSDVDSLAQTLRLRTDFAANTSHELRTPIASIKAAIETLRGAAADDPAMHTKLEEVIENNATRLEETVDDLLDLSRLEAEDATAASEPIDAPALCASLVGRFDPVCERRNLTIEFDIDPALRRMVSDRKRLVLILRNLIDNATKFAFEGTAVRVSGEAIDETGTPPGPGAARFRVTDRGVGIPLSHQSRIFERFYQVDESRARLGGRRGSGLGLSIVRHAVLSIGGTIEVESVWQEGTTMTVTIPACVEPG